MEYKDDHLLDLMEALKTLYLLDLRLRRQGICLPQAHSLSHKPVLLYRQNTTGLTWSKYVL